MQNANVFLELIRERGKKGLPLERLYRQLFNPALYLLAYDRIYRNKGIVTAKNTEETIAGMSLAKVDAMINALRQERYTWTPVRRTSVEKENSPKKRPLELSTWSDKLLQAVIQLILEAYYEPQFSPHSHAFRPEQGCHTALREIYHSWTETAWFIKGHIQASIDSMDHTILVSILAEKIHDGRFIQLISELLKAGYLEDWKHNLTLSGMPQGGVLHPIFLNIYLDRLDQFIETEIIPAYTRGDKRRDNPVYVQKLAHAYTLKKQGKIEAAAAFKEVRKLPSVDPDDPAFRRLRYVRYADDFLLGFAGTHAEAEEIRQRIGEFLQKQLKLELSATHLLVTHATMGITRFLDYEISVKCNNNARFHKGKRVLNKRIELRIPADVLQEKCQPYMSNGKPIHRMEYNNETAFSLITRYQAEYRECVEYYQLAHNLAALTHLEWVMEASLTMTLARKFRITVAQVYERYGSTIHTDKRTTKVLQDVIVSDPEKRPLVAQWGGIPLIRNMQANLDDRPSCITNNTTLESRMIGNGQVRFGWGL